MVRHCICRLSHHRQEYNKDVKLYLLEGADHGGSEFFSDDVLDIIEEFLQKIISAS